MFRLPDQRVAVVGADDPEMTLIVALLIACDISVVYAKYNGERVRPEKAYRVTSPKPESGQIWIECAPVAGFGDKNVYRIDHHNPGDPGYDCSPDLFWEGSSLGQLYKLLGIEPTQEALVAAAADHCLFEAYQGYCPGVHPLEVWEWQITQTALRHGLDREIVEIQLSEYEVLLAGMEPTKFDFGFEAYLFKDPFKEFWRFMCLRDLCFSESIAYVVFLQTSNEKGVRHKLCISGNVSQDFVRGFLAGVYFHGLSGKRYGCPVRRYAGIEPFGVLDD